MTTDFNPLRDYTDQGIAAVLDGVVDLIGRAATLRRNTKTAIIPPLVAAAWRKEADLCLAEAEELIARVRAQP